MAEMRVVRSRPDQAILEEALRELLLGSTTHRVVQRATVPVLLVRVPEADTGSGV